MRLWIQWTLPKTRNKFTDRLQVVMVAGGTRVEFLQFQKNDYLD